MSDKDRIPAEVFILFKLEGLKTALSDSPFCTACCQEGLLVLGKAKKRIFDGMAKFYFTNQRLDGIISYQWQR